MDIEHSRDFGTRECPSCSTEVAKNNNRCPICGYEFPVDPPGKKATVWLVATVLLILLIGAWVLRAW